MFFLEIKDAGGREWRHKITPDEICTIGRSQINSLVLNDPRASRHHAFLTFSGDKITLVDGQKIGDEIKRSANGVFINNLRKSEANLVEGDEVLIGASILRIRRETTQKAQHLDFDDKPLSGTQLLISANDVLKNVFQNSGKLRGSSSVQDDAASLEQTERELLELRRKSQILELLYEMSKTLGTVFDLKTIFVQATELILRVTPADRVVALLKTADKPDEPPAPIAVQARAAHLAAMIEKLPISRTITNKVMNERIAILSQDARDDVQFSGSESIVSLGIRSTICAPLITETGVHGALYADRLDSFSAFTADDLQLISAVAAQTALAVETIRAHEKLAREEVARANYSRFLPPYVVKQILEKPESIKLGGVNQKVTVLFADIRGFTSLAENEPPERVLNLLNEYFSVMTDIIFAHGGTLDKYIGDGLMALFGAPTVSDEDAANSVSAAVAMQKKVCELNRDLAAKGAEQIGVGIGLHTGEATVGYVGSEKRSEYTAIGDTVNLAARLESNARAGQILVSETTARDVNTNDFDLRERPPLTVKNRLQPVSLFELIWK